MNEGNVTECSSANGTPLNDATGHWKNEKKGPMKRGLDDGEGRGAERSF